MKRKTPSTGFDRYIAGLAAILITVALYVMGVGLHACFPAFDALPLYVILVVAMAILCVVNRVAAGVFASRRYDMSPDERRAMVDAHTNECRTDAEAVLRRMSDMDVIPVTLLVLYYLLTAAMAVACGMAVRWSLLLPAYLLFMPLYRHISLRSARLNPDPLVPADELPHLHALAQKAADAVGVKGKVRLQITDDGDMAINRFGRTYLVMPGTRLLAACTEEELYQLLLYHFELYADPALPNRMTRRHRLAHLGSAKMRGATWIFDLFFSFADAHYEWDYNFYLVAVAWQISQRSCARVVRDGTPAVLLHGRAKEEMARYFDFEFEHYVTEPFYAPQMPRRDRERTVCEAYRRALTERYTFWSALLDKEIPTGVYPPLREERVKLGLSYTSVSDGLSLPDWNTPYGAECAAAIAQADARLYAAMTLGYAEARKSSYLEPLSVVEAWEQSDKNRPTSELSPVINAYRDLERRAEAEALCDTILDTEPNLFAQAHALYFKGMCMLHRWEPESIDLIYRAIDINKNYMKDGFEAVGQLCCLMGLTEEYETYRRRYVNVMQAHNDNQEGACSLAVTDRLEKEEAIGHMLPDILGYMEQVSDGCLERVYLVRKVVSEDFFTSAFVLYFTPGASEEQMHKAYVDIFNYLDAYPIDWQFSLFVYNRETERAVQKVAGSLVWEKKKD